MLALTYPIGTGGGDASFAEDEYLIHLRQVLKLMGDKNPSLVLHKFALDTIIEEAATHMGVHSRERIVEQVHINVPVHRSGHIDALLLASREVHSSFANFLSWRKKYNSLDKPMQFEGGEKGASLVTSCITRRKNLKIRQQGADLKSEGVSLFVKGSPEEDVVPDGGIANPCLLCYIGHSTIYLQQSVYENTIIIIRKKRSSILWRLHNSPFERCSSPSRECRRADLPDPTSPTIATSAPRCTSKWISRSAERRCFGTV